MILELITMILYLLFKSSKDMRWLKKIIQTLLKLKIGHQNVRFGLKHRYYGYLPNLDTIIQTVKNIEILPKIPNVAVKKLALTTEIQ